MSWHVYACVWYVFSLISTDNIFYLCIISWPLFLLHGRVTIHTCNMLHVVWQLEPRCQLDAAHSKQQAATPPHRLPSWPCRHLNGLWFVCNLLPLLLLSLMLQLQLLNSPAPPPQSNPAETREFLICSRQWEAQCKCQQGAPVGGGLERGVGSGEGGGGMTKACRPLCQLASFSLSGSASEVICPFSPNSPLKFT